MNVSETVISSYQIFIPACLNSLITKIHLHAFSGYKQIFHLHLELLSGCYILLSTNRVTLNNMPGATLLTAHQKAL